MFKKKNKYKSAIWKYKAIPYMIKIINLLQ